ncbi:MAG TPA: hypothetical protein PLB55_02530 [Prosthecobacter sp.]|nr:hypothetical protein [Prosthecobacter sp.]
MNAPTSIHRRQFLRSTAATAGGLWLSGFNQTLSAASIEGETKDFWYRMPSADEPYIDTQRDSKAFAFQGTQIMLSEDNGKTWPHRAEFPEAQNITFSVILKNGNVLFATLNRLFLSTDNLKTHREIIVKRPDGGDYRPHDPVDPKAPGWYYHSLDGEHCFEVNGREMLVWGTTATCSAARCR